MRRTRPPCRKAPAPILIITVCSCIAGQVSAQDLNLPDLILPGNLRPDIDLPATGNFVADPWEAIPLRYRRIYPLAGIISSDTPAVPVSTEIVHEISPVEGSLETAGIESREKDSRWFAGAEYDIREGAYLSAGRRLGAADILAAEAYLPFGTAVVRSWVIGADWNRTGDISGNLRAGAKFNSVVSPYSFADFRWDRPLGSPDSYELVLNALGGDDGGVGGRIGFKLDFPLGAGDWRIGTIIGGGGSYGNAGSDWKTDVGLFGAANGAEGRLQILFGVQGLLRSNLTYNINPLLSLLWRPTASVSLFAVSRYEFGIEGVDSLVFEDIGTYDPELPAYASYRLGATLGREGEITSKISVTGAYGRFAFGDSGDVTVEDGYKIGIDGNLRIPMSSTALRADAAIDWYPSHRLIAWSADAVWELEPLDVSFRSGSADVVLGGGIPGIRSDMPIIGMGTDWKAGESWVIGLFGYAGLPWESPSLTISAGWRN